MWETFAVSPDLDLLELRSLLVPPHAADRRQ
jgi:hypothetical protein